MNAPPWVKRIRRAFSWTVGKHAPQEPWWAEFWSSFATALWGAWGFINQPPVWSVPALEIVTLVASMWMWFAVAVILGVWQGVVVRRLMPHGRWWASLFLAWFWFCMTIATAMADFGRPGLAFYVMLLGINLHSILRLRTD